MARLTACLILIAALVSAPAANAHHSNAMYDTAKTVAVDGVVTRYEWANPHVYIFIVETTPTGRVEWEVEGQPPAMLSRTGWSKDTLAAGDMISITGNPYKDASRNSILLVTMRKAGATVYDYKTFFAKLAAPSETAATPSTGLAGTWSTVLTPAVVYQFADPKGRLPMTAKGEAASGEFDENTMNPGANCVATTAPFFMLAPDVKQVTIAGDTVRVVSEFAAAERVIHLDVPSHDGAEPSVQGHSIGRWENGALVIDTAAFAPHREGNASSVPSGAQKHLVERLTLREDKKALIYHFELTDPEYLAKPVVGDVEWDYRPDVTFMPQTCSLENARRYLSR
jgi:hypothetical protein